MSRPCKDECRHETDTSQSYCFYGGKKRCMNCKYNKVTNDLKCYCCKSQYRTKPKNMKYKRDHIVDVVRY